MNFELVKQLLLGMILLVSSCTPNGGSAEVNELSNPGLTVRLYWLRSFQGNEPAVSQLVSSKPSSFDMPCSVGKPDSGGLEPRIDEIPAVLPDKSPAIVVGGPFGGRLDPESPEYSVYSRARIIYSDKYDPNNLIIEAVSEHNDQARVTVLFKDSRFPNGIREYYYLISSNTGWKIFYASDRENTIPNPSFGISDPRCAKSAS